MVYNIPRYINLALFSEIWKVLAAESYSLCCGLPIFAIILVALSLFVNDCATY
jgi:hypothetical protein